MNYIDQSLENFEKVKHIHHFMNTIWGADLESIK